MKIVKICFNKNLNWTRHTVEDYASGRLQFRTFGPIVIRMEDY